MSNELAVIGSTLTSVEREFHQPSSPEDPHGRLRMRSSPTAVGIRTNGREVGEASSMAHSGWLGL
ncbi:hypothetical protein RRF57_006122 [Xylaria bambusicola]|uniref:Uncharacterized protein n=1 Tax=Xylaria bambusicola TaxID=326684 RepID=A0AAN7Z5B8_9PEZI